MRVVGARRCYHFRFRARESVEVEFPSITQNTSGRDAFAMKTLRVAFRVSEWSVVGGMQTRVGAVKTCRLTFRVRGLWWVPVGIPSVTRNASGRVAVAVKTAVSRFERARGLWWMGIPSVTQNASGRVAVAMKTRRLMFRASERFVVGGNPLRHSKRE